MKSTQVSYPTKETKQNRYTRSTTEDSPTRLETQIGISILSNIISNRNTKYVDTYDKVYLVSKNTDGKLRRYL